MLSVTLYFGSFNPIHKGHIAIAEYVLSENIADELWFVVSPQNPLKPAGMLINEDDRLEMVRLAISDSPFAGRMKACDIEFSLPRPSYTVDTLRALEERYPDTEFSVLVGSDILGQFMQWKEWGRLIEGYDFYVYPRRGYGPGPMPGELLDKFTILYGAPYFDFSSTAIRDALSGGGAEDMLPGKVYEYIKEHNLWKAE